MVLVARIRFTPTQYSKSSGGVAIPENGIFTHVANGFAATTEGYLINGNLVEQVSLPQDLPLYPVRWDVDDNGKVNALDYLMMGSVFDFKTDHLPAEYTKYKIMDYQPDGYINVKDNLVFGSYYDKKVTNKDDSFYAETDSPRDKDSYLSSNLVQLTESVTQNNSMEFQQTASETDSALIAVLLSNREQPSVLNSKPEEEEALNLIAENVLEFTDPVPTVFTELQKSTDTEWDYPITGNPDNTDRKELEDALLKESEFVTL